MAETRKNNTRARKISFELSHSALLNQLYTTPPPPLPAILARKGIKS